MNANSSSAKLRVLASDLDGTLLPLSGNQQHLDDLHAIGTEVARHGLQLLFVTGRHFASVAGLFEHLPLPTPNWIIGDVGTSIYAQVPQSELSRSELPQPDFFEPAQLAEHFQLMPAYADHLSEIVGPFTVEHLAAELTCLPQLRRQEDEKQTRFKLSYYLDARDLSSVVAQLESILSRLAAPYSHVASVDPFTGDGLLDLLPRGVTKAFALDWWSAHSGYDRESIIYAGDSGNDSAVFASGYRSVIVANAIPSVLAAARQAHQSAGWKARLYSAPSEVTSGVLSGLRHFLRLSEKA